jgi:hypothetical protein
MRTLEPKPKCTKPCINQCNSHADDADDVSGSVDICTFRSRSAVGTHATAAGKAAVTAPRLHPLALAHHKLQCPESLMRLSMYPMRE